VESADVYRALWRHKLFILVGTAALALAAWYFTSQETKTYTAQALVRIQQSISSPGQAESSLAASQQLARSYAAIIGAGALDPRVSGLLARQGSSGKAGDASFSAEPLEDLDLLWIKGTSSNPERAGLIANTAALALKSFIAERGSLGDKLDIVSPAATPTKSSSPDVALNIAIAILLGLILNSAVALLLELFSDRLPEADELEATLGRPVLGAIPSLPLVSRDTALAAGSEHAASERWRSGVG
jgi:capsular polysaccharide biosynthesis protein